MVYDNVSSADLTDRNKTGDLRDVSLSEQNSFFCLSKMSHSDLHIGFFKMTYLLDMRIDGKE